MIYYRLRKDFRDYPVNALLTETELTKMHVSTFIPSLFDKIELSKRSVYWFFGARFENNTFVDDISKSEAFKLW